MDDERFKQEISGALYAHELILNVLLKHYVDRQLADTGEDTEHLDAFVEQLQAAFEAQKPRMSPEAAGTAERTFLRLLGASLQKYWS